MNENHYSTEDLYLAAYLQCKNIELIDARREDTKRVKFCFHNTDKIQRYVQEFFARQGAVKPLIYADAVRSLKGLIYRR